MHYFGITKSGTNRFNLGPLLVQWPHSRWLNGNSISSRMSCESLNNHRKPLLKYNIGYREAMKHCCVVFRRKQQTGITYWSIRPNWSISYSVIFVQTGSYYPGGSSTKPPMIPSLDQLSKLQHWQILANTGKYWQTLASCPLWKQWTEIIDPYNPGPFIYYT